MGRSPVDYIIACIIIIACMWTDSVGQESGPACTTNAVFEYCLSQQGLNLSQSKTVQCSVDRDTYQTCQLESLQNCPFGSPIHEGNFLRPYIDLLRECTFPDSSSCLSSPCLNGGTCTNVGSFQRCFCPFGFYGNECQETSGQGGPKSNFDPGVTDKPCVDCGRKNGNSDGLGIDAIAGIAIGAVVAVLLFAILLAVLFKRKHRKPDSTQPGVPLSTVQPRRGRHSPTVQLPPESTRNAPNRRLPEGSSPTSKYKTKRPSPRLPNNDYRHPSVSANKHPLGLKGEYLTPIPSESYHHHADPNTRIPPPEHHPSVNISPKLKSSSPVIQFLSTDDSRQTLVTTNVPLRWEEDYVTPVPSEIHHHIQRQTSDGYLKPVTQNSDALVYEGVHVYTEIDES